MYFLAALLTLRMVRDTHRSGQTEPQHLPTALASILRSAPTLPPQVRLTVAQLKRSERRALVRLALCSADEGVATAVLNAAASLTSFQVGQSHYEVERIDLSDPAWSGLGTWADMYCGKPGRFMRFTFATPLITAEPVKPSQTGNALPFPEPLLLFQCLGNSWEGLDGGALPRDVEHLVRASSCVVSSYRLRTLPVEDGLHALVGYLGKIEYECRTPDSPCLAPLNALTRLAFFTGVGYGTDRGLGTTATEIGS